MKKNDQTYLLLPGLQLAPNVTGLAPCQICRVPLCRSVAASLWKRVTSSVSGGFSFLRGRW